MGRRTYQAVRAGGVWPYAGKSTVVMTRGRPLDGDGLAVFDDRTPAEIVADLAHAGRRHIWMVGGGGPLRTLHTACSSGKASTVVAASSLASGSRTSSQRPGR